MGTIAQQSLLPLADMGFHRIGYGGFSDVYGKDGCNMVIKIGHGDHWFEYISWLKDNNYLGSFGPKVYKARRLTDHSYIAIVEKLYKFDDIDLYDDIICLFKYLPSISVKQRINLLNGIQDGFGEFWYKISKHDPYDLARHNWMIRKTDKGNEIVLNDPGFDPADYKPLSKRVSL